MENNFYCRSAMFHSRLLLNLSLVVTLSHLHNYADDNTLYCFGNNKNDVTNKLRIDSTHVMKWFSENCMVLNADKCHYMLLGKDTENVKIYFDGNNYANSNEEKKNRY